MKDLNFFESYIEKKEFHIDKQWLYYFIGILLIFLIIFYSIYNQIRINRLSKDIVKLKSIVEDNRINKKVEEIKEKEKEVSKFKEHLEKIKLLDEIVEEDSVIDNHLLDSITSRVPDDIFFTSTSLYTDHIEIVGKSIDRWAIASLGKSLESIDDFQDIFISSISKEEQFFNFVLNINLKDVNSNGEDESVEKNEIEESNDQE